MAGNILDDILAARRLRLERAKARTAPAEMEGMARRHPRPAFNLKEKLLSSCPAGIHVIAEVKKASPSKGVLRADFRPLEIARAYLRGGASALSVLTEEDFFQGRDDYLEQIARQVPLPVLRKDFIFDPYQVFEARCLGASAFLLIAACLAQRELAALISLGRSLDLSPLVEVHTRAELETALGAGADIIGINNRDLRTFETRLEATEQLRPLVPQGIPVVSESGIFTRADMDFLRRNRVQAALIGESLMREPDMAAKLEELLAR